MLDPTMIRGAPPPAPAVPPLWKRVLLLPFVPSLWADARHWSFAAVAVPLFVSATLWSGALATYRGVELRGLLSGLATDWDARFDPLVIENGEARVEGERLPQGSDESTLMLVDPEDTTPAPSDGRYIIVRKRTVIRDDGPPVDLKQFQDMLGGGVIRIDGKTMLGWVAKWGAAVQLGLLVLLVGFEWVGTVLGLLYGLMVGAVLMSFFGKSRGLTSEGCTRVGVATMAVKPVLSVVLGLAGTSVHVCLGLFVWPALGVALGAWALSRLPAAQAS